MSANGTHVLGLGAVDLVAEDPPAATQALAVPSLAAEAACAARGDARDEHPVADLDRLDTGADGLDRPYRLVAEDPSVGHRGNVTLEDVEIGAADGDGVDADDRVGVAQDRWLWRVLPGLLAGSVVHERLHVRPPDRPYVDNERNASDQVEAKVTLVDATLVQWAPRLGHEEVAGCRAGPAATLDHVARAAQLRGRAATAVGSPSSTSTLSPVSRPSERGRSVPHDVFSVRTGCISAS